MSLHVEVSGSGEPVVLLHGWGMQGDMWSDVAVQLAQDFKVYNVDLPGHGKSLLRHPFTLDSLVDQLCVQFAQPVSVVGWSLGGIISLNWAARNPENVSRLMLVASTPCFTASPDWDFGMPQETLELFAAELEKNYAATLRRFLSLQLRGSENERELLTVLRDRLFARGEPSMAALRGGLDILRNADLRPMLSQIMQPTLAIVGQRDKLTPPQASHYLARLLSHARAVEIEGAAHAPFLSHPAIFIEHLKSFLHE
jgi:pimeloyl-[acyl-carrier protein] methyl ester esterase